MKRRAGMTNEEEFFQHFTIGNLDARSVQHGPRIFPKSERKQHGGNHEDRGAHPQDRRQLGDGNPESHDGIRT